MKWIKDKNYKSLPGIATVGNSFFYKPSVYSLKDEGVIWASVVRIKPTAETPFWRVVYVKNGEYEIREFKHLKDAKLFGEQIVQKIEKGDDVI